MTALAELIGESPSIVAVKEQIGRLLRLQSDARRLPPILIHGETGTGKGLLARSIHRSGPRAAGPFVDVNCAAIPETLLETELFGFERGAFTDARQAKPGLFQVAHGGTIFLDEVGLLPAGLQGKLLTVLEERAVRRLGGTRSEPIDVWILTATNEDLVTAVSERRFREDLYHRLAVLTLWLPTLRERGEDILLLAEHFLARTCADYALPPRTFTADARAALLAYRWPGNIRELANVMERVALLSDEPLVTAAGLGLAVIPAVETGDPTHDEEAVALEDVVGSAEQAHLLEVLRRTDWNISRAAARLGISRNTLRYRMEKYGLRRGAPAPPAPRRAPRPPAPTPVIPTAPPAAAPKPGGLRWERRPLTLLRVALAPPRGAISSPDSRRPLEVLVEKVQNFGGRVEELGSTGMVAVFGLEPLEDAPNCAAHVAMAIQKVAERARRDDPETMAVKIGIHAGQFPVGLAGGGAEIDFDAKREAGAVLEALVGAAAPGAILVSGVAAPLLERRFELVPVGALMQVPGRAYRLAGRERAGLVFEGRVTGFVGRSDELELLRSRLTSAVRGQGQVVGIVGEPGLGKSRLLYEFRQTLRGEPVTYLEGRCLSYGSSLPYFPVLDMFRHACRLAETDGPELVAEKVRRSLEDLGMEAEEAAPYLLARLGIKEGTERLAVLTPEAINIRTREILRQMSLKASRQRPLVLAIENLHWVDKTSEAYFASLVESLPGASILVLMTYRPGYRPSWLEKSYATQMALQPLPPQESLSVVHSVLQTEEIPDPLTQLIVTKAEGNPFFLEELARAVRDLGDLRPALAVPDTIQEVLLARIDRLPDGPKRLLQTASILGRQVSLRLLREIWEGPGVLDAHLQELTRLEFLYERTGGEEPVYVFKHALTQEVAYETLLAGSRQVLHSAAGRALEALYADRLEAAYERLAYHYSKTDKAEKAVDYLTRVAEKAARAFAHEEAVAALREGLRHAERLPAEERDPRLLDLVLHLAHSLSFLGRFQETLDFLLREQDRLERLHAPRLAGPYHFWLAHTYSYLGDQERAADHARRAIEEAERSGDEATMGKAYVVLAQEDYWSGQPLQGIERGRRAVDPLERTGEQWWLGLAYWIVGINYIAVGDFEQALLAEACARAIGEAIGDPRIQSYATWTTGWIHVLTGEWERGIDAMQHGLERSPDPVNTAVVLGHLGYAYLEKGDLSQAITLLEQSVTQMTQFRFRRLQGRFTTFLGEACLANGQAERARELSSQGLEISRDAKYWYGVGWAQEVLGRIAQTSGLLSDAEGHFQEALRAFAGIHAQFMAGRTHLALAELAHAQGNHATAATHLQEARDRFRALRVARYAERAEQLAVKLQIPIPAGE